MLIMRISKYFIKITDGFEFYFVNKY